MNYVVKFLIKLAVGIFLLAWLNKVKQSAIENIQDAKKHFNI